MRLTRIAHSLALLHAISRLICLPEVSFGQTAGQSSAEAVNPFNEFMSPSGGVNLFSGDVAYTHPLYTLRGRNGMHLPLEMNYSSNVRLNVLARNDMAPTDWTGLGWRFGYGFVKCDANRTITPIDDRCVYVSPKGVSQQILRNGSGFVLEKEPFWKVERTVSTDGNRVLGWTLTDVMGRKFSYGDFQEPAVLRSATRYELAWPGVGFVGVGFNKTPTLYPTQWDLASEADVAGNLIRFAYEQKTESLKMDSWGSGKSYTKASYLKTISISDNETAEFFRTSKTKDETYDPWDFQPEPDAFFDPQEEEYLDRVEIRNRAGLKIREFRFGYEVRSFVEKPGYAKRFLTEIREFGISNFIGSNRFNYAFERPDKGDYPLGMMLEMESPLCAKVRFEFTKVGLERSNINRISRPDLDGKFSDSFVPVAGKLPGGGEFMVINDGGEEYTCSSSNFFVFNNEDGIWRIQRVKTATGDAFLDDDLGLTGRYFTRVIAGEGFFLVTKYDPLEPRARKGLVSLFEWDGKDWRATNIYNKRTETGLPFAGNSSGRISALYGFNPINDPKAIEKLKKTPA